METRPPHIGSNGSGLYVHIPYCQRKCHYCSFHSVPLRDRNPRPLVQALLTEMNTYRLDDITTAYLGGGSPTRLPQPALDELLEGIQQACPPLREWTLECNPGETTGTRLQEVLSRGVNRLSFGVQSLDPRELQTLGRTHSPTQAVQAIRQAQSLGCTNVSMDLIFAIPHSTLATWAETLAAALDLGVQHISTYSLSYEPGTPLDKSRQSGAVRAIDEATDRAMYEMAIDTLTAAGYEHYEISNFARPGYACQHNLGTWHNRPYLGIGPGAGSYWQGIRRQNMTDIDTYCDQIATGKRPWAEQFRPPAEDRLCETAVLGLRTIEGVDLGQFSRQTGSDFWQAFGRIAQHHIQQGLLEHRENRVCLTPQALPIADTVLCDFAAF